VSFDPAALPNDVDALKSIIGDMVRDAVAARTEIEKLRFQLARFKRAQFGPKVFGSRGQVWLVGDPAPPARPCPCVQLIISDACHDLLESAAEYLPEARWQATSAGHGSAPSSPHPSMTCRDG
jgi:hypothetical protein